MDTDKDIGDCRRPDKPKFASWDDAYQIIKKARNTHRQHPYKCNGHWHIQSKPNRSAKGRRKIRQHHLNGDHDNDPNYRDCSICRQIKMRKEQRPEPLTHSIWESLSESPLKDKLNTYWEETSNNDSIN